MSISAPRNMLLSRHTRRRKFIAGARRRNGLAAGGEGAVRWPRRVRRSALRCHHRFC
jgi:hypothetical protein